MDIIFYALGIVSGGLIMIFFNFYEEYRTEAKVRSERLDAAIRTFDAMVLEKNKKI